MSSLEIKIDGFPSGETRTDTENQDLAKKIKKAISSVLDVELTVKCADSYKNGGSHEIEVELFPTVYDDLVKVKFGTGSLEREFTFTGWDIYGEHAFDEIANSGCYNDTGGGWRDTYRRLFSPLVAEYLRDPKYIEQTKECPHFSFEPISEVKS